MKNKTKAFTLVELIATVIILGLIGLLVYPTISDVILESNEKAYQKQVEEVERAASIWAMSNQKVLPTGANQKYILYISDLYEAGIIDKNTLLNPETDEELDGCIVIRWDTSSNQHSYSFDNGCIASRLPKISLSVADGSINESGWANKNFYVSVNGEYLDSYNYCVSNDECNPETEVIANKGAVLVSTEGVNFVCVTGKNLNDVTDKVCDSFKLDKTAPTFSGLDEIEVLRNSTVDFITGVLMSDELSGNDGNFTYNPTTIDTSVFGSSHTVTYSGKDLAGNVASVERTILIETDKPQVEFVVNGNPINSDGWAKQRFYVTANVTDFSRKGLKVVNWCVSGSGNCTPTTSTTNSTISAYIQTDSVNNKVCVEAIDNKDKSSGIICSDAYKLDTVLPSMASGNIIKTGTLGSNGWYTGNVSISYSNSSDLSGIVTSSVTPNTVTSDTTGTNISISATDRAGNLNSTTITIKRDSQAPSTPTITGGRTSYDLTQTISLSSASTDYTSGVSHYEYYVNSSSSTPSSSVSAHGTTSGTKIFNTDYNGEYVFYRAVDYAGNKSAWSNGQQLYVRAFTGDLTFSTSSYGTINVTPTSNVSNYKIKYVSGNQNESYFLTSGTDITSSKSFSVSNGIYSVAIVNSEQTKAYVKKVYIYNFDDRSTSRSRSISVSVSGISSTVGSSFTNTGTSSASLSGSTLTISASGGSRYAYDIGYSCRGYGYTCSSGTVKGSNCEIPSTYTSSASVSYSCPSGYSPSGSVSASTTCSKTTPGASCSTIKSCSIGQDVGYGCKYAVACYQSECNKYSWCTFVSGSAAAGATYSCIYAYSYSCPSGCSASGSGSSMTCSKPSSTSTTSPNASYSCPSGCSLKPGSSTCSCPTTSSTPASYSCTDGWDPYDINYYRYTVGIVVQ